MQANPTGPTRVIPHFLAVHKTGRSPAVNMLIQRIFGTTIHGGSSAINRRQLPIEQIRHSLRRTLDDCKDKDIRAQRVMFKINAAKTPADLWMLRSDLHQCISQVHSQRVAVERINSLVDVFEGWIPPSQLTRIQG
jgi:hypothetical protein